MKFTVAINMCEASHYLALAQAADSAGWDGACVPDSPFFPQQASADYPYTPDGSRFWPSDTPFMEPWVVIPAMAAVTQRLRFYTHVLKLPIRHPLLVAKTIASAAVLSGERILLGVGTSWIPEEAAWCGTDFRTRGKRTDEAIEIIRLCLGGGMVSWQGEHYQFGPLEMAPVPSAPVPIIVGGHSRAALRRAARLGDGWCSANLTTAEVAPLVQQVRALREEAGRAEEPFEIQALCTDAFDADGFRRMRDIGVTDAIVWPWPLFGGNPAELEDKLDSLARFAETIIEPLRAEG